ncbi:MAG: chemotaxis protein CheW [Nitrospirae bacterium]|nr:chemotaxis protein CheW [Nitrospirota bacterium]
MTHKENVEPEGLPAEMDLLVFKAAGIPIAIDTVQVDCIISSEQAEQRGISCLALAEVPGMAKEASALSSTVVLHKHEDEVYGIRVDGLETIVAVPVRTIQPIPEPLSYFAGLRIFWGVVLHENTVVLLLDPYRLKGLNPCEAAATA